MSEQTTRLLEEHKKMIENRLRTLEENVEKHMKMIEDRMETWEEHVEKHVKVFGDVATAMEGWIAANGAGNTDDGRVARSGWRISCFASS